VFPCSHRKVDCAGADSHSATAIGKNNKTFSIMLFAGSPITTGAGMAVKQGNRDGDTTDRHALHSSWSHNPLQRSALMPRQGGWIYEISPSAPTALVARIWPAACNRSRTKVNTLFKPVLESSVNLSP